MVDTSRRSLGLVCIVLAGSALACERDGSAEAAANTVTASNGYPSPEVAAIAAYTGPSILGAPRYPAAVPDDQLSAFMREAWTEAGEPAALYDLRVGEALLVTDDPFDLVRDFYLPYVHKVFMDHAMEFPDIGSQRMFTGLLMLPDGGLVKFTITRPFFRYPDQAAVDRTVIQIGRVGGTS